MSNDPEICICAIDPGLGGAISFYFPAAPEPVAVDDMPVAAGEIDLQGLRAESVSSHRPLRWSNKSAPCHGMVSGQAFGFGGAYAAARATVTLCEVPLRLVTPITWKRHHGLVGKEDPKEAARALALRLFQASAERFERKKDHNRAEAALIASFAAGTMGGRT